MHLQLTKKVYEWLKQDLIIKDTDYDMYAWHVNFQYVAGKRFVLLMHDLSRFSVILYAVKKKEMLDAKYIFNTIFHALLYQGYDEDLALKYLHHAPTKISFSKTKNNNLISRMNRAMEDALAIASYDGLNFDHVEQLHVTKKMNEFIVGQDKFKVTYYPEEKMLELIKMMLNE